MVKKFDAETGAYRNNIASPGNTGETMTLMHDNTAEEWEKAARTAWEEIRRLQAQATEFQERRHEAEIRESHRRVRVAAALEQLRSVFNLRPDCNVIEDAVEDACNEIVRLREGRMTWAHC